MRASNALLHDPTLAGGGATTANPAACPVPNPPAEAGEGRSDRTTRFLARVDREIAGLDAEQRHAFLSRLLEGWERRYRMWIRTDGKSEFCADPANPINAADFILTISGLGARMKG